jgi:TetR/AcrR family transcriptional regulator
LRQAYRVAISESELPADFDAASRASMGVAYVVGRWHRYSKSGFRKLPTEGLDEHLTVLLGH